MGLTNSIRVGKLQLMRVEDVIHAGGCPLLQGTMQNDQGLLGHARVHENVYPASKVHESTYCHQSLTVAMVCCNS